MNKDGKATGIVSHANLVRARVHSVERWCRSPVCVITRDEQGAVLRVAAESVPGWREAGDRATT
ncbi:hypothetical protein OKW33_006194 [Paraburkholderia atlantica]|uniref:hypothetical protein n=1 Tax=Paraburkholderia atlantica TaxID=2654982 RepID=UPI0012FB999A|nr:hypothetical protein [Paraburkholderia atlantica]NUY35663.1 hypothetical protein [Paraburkholderia atlantica]